MITEKEIIKQFLGVPYKNGGRDLNGIDCWGLIVAIYKLIGIEVLDMGDYEAHWSKKGKNYFIENYYSDWQEHGTYAFLDVVLFKNSNGVPFHAGVYLSYNRIMQATAKGVITSEIKGKMKERVFGIFRHVEVAKGLK
jgi:cell wall-associated NlpC family hydrolase